MKTRILQVWGVALTLAFTAYGAHAEMPVDAPDVDNDPEVRVINNHAYRVRIVLVDKTGRHHSLGRVAPDRAMAFDLNEFTEMGLPVQLKVVVDEPVWSPGATDKAVRSGSLYISDHTEVRVWVASDLTDTEVEVHAWR